MNNQFSGYLLVSTPLSFCKVNPKEDKVSELCAPGPRSTARKCNIPKGHTYPLPRIQIRLDPKVHFPNNFTSALSMNMPSPSDLPPHNPPLPYRTPDVISPPQQFLQSSLCRIFLRRVHILPVVPVASRDRKPRDGDVAGPGGTFASAVREDLVFWGGEVALGAVG